MASHKITIQVPNSTRTSVKVISKIAKSTQKKRMLGEAEKISYTKKETKHLEIENSTEEDIIGDSMKNTHKKRQGGNTEPKEDNKCKTKRQKKSSQTLQPITATKRNKKERAKSVSQSNKEQIQEDMVNDDKIVRL